MAAAAQVAGELPAALADVRFLSPLVVPETGTRRVQVVLAGAEEGEATFQVFSRTDGAGPDAALDGPWTLHATGRVRPADGEGGNGRPEAVDLAAVRGRCPNVVAGADLYPRLAAQGLQYGPRFQGIARLWHGEGEALGEVSAPAGLLPDLAAYHVHPAVLDACGQVVAAAGNGAGDEGRSFVPAGLDELRIYGRPGTHLWSHAWRRAEEGADGAATRVGDGRLLDDEGRVVVEARGMRLRALDGGSSRGAGFSPADWLYELRWEPIALPEPPAAAAPPAGWLIFADGLGAGDELAARLGGMGERCAVVSPGPAWEELPEGRFRIRAGEVEDVRRLLDHLVAGGWPPLRGVVHLWSLDAVAAGDVTVASLEEAERQGCGAALPLVQELLLRAGVNPPRLWLVTRGAQPVGNGPVAVAQAPLWGFGRSLAQEHPSLWGGLIDLDPEEGPAECAGRLARQLLAPGDETQVVWRSGVAHGARLARRRDLLQPDGPAPRWRTDGTYLVTGGLGGLGLEVARWMIARGARRLILLGRTQLPPRATWSGIDSASRAGRQVGAVRDLEARGAAVHVAPVDVADEGQLADFLEGFRREGWPPIRGVVHAAGVLQDQAVLQLDAAALAAVFRAKVLGAWLLHRLLDREPLDFFLLFSSAAALLGSAGQANYAAANAFLDVLAHLRRGEGKPASSLAWGPWAEVGLAARDGRGERMARRGLVGIPPEQGLEVLERLLARDPVHVGIVAVDWERLLAAFPAYRAAPLLRDVAAEETGPGPGGGGAAAVLAALRAAPPAERRPQLQALLAEQVGRVVGLPAAQLDPRRPLNDLGVDSLMAAELRSRVERELGISVPIVRLLESPNLADFTGLLLEQLEMGRSEPSAPLPEQPLVVTLQPEGSRTPFTCVHPGALEVQCYEGLARALGPAQPFRVLQPPELDNYRGLDGGPTPDATLEEAADRCVQALREVQPAGPYVLGGWSMGGVLAWTIGCRLAAAGEEVARLVLLDSPAPPAGGQAPDDYDDDRLLPVFARYLGARQGRDLAAPDGDPRDRLRRLLPAAVAAGAVPPGCDERQLAALLQIFKAGLLRSVRQLWASRPAAMGVAPFPITLLRPLHVLEAFADLFPVPAARWAELTSATLEVRQVSGDHYTLFLPQNVGELAREVERALAPPT